MLCAKLKSNTDAGELAARPNSELSRKIGEFFLKKLSFYNISTLKTDFSGSGLVLRRRMQSGVAGYALHGEFYTRVGRHRGRKKKIKKNRRCFLFEKKEKEKKREEEKQQ